MASDTTFSVILSLPILSRYFLTAAFLPCTSHCFFNAELFVPATETLTVTSSSPAKADISIAQAHAIAMMIRFI